MANCGEDRRCAIWLILILKDLPTVVPDNHLVEVSMSRSCHFIDILVTGVMIVANMSM